MTPKIKAAISAGFLITAVILLLVVLVWSPTVFVALLVVGVFAGFYRIAYYEALDFLIGKSHDR